LIPPALAKLARVLFRILSLVSKRSAFLMRAHDQAYFFLCFSLPMDMQYSSHPSLSTSLSRVSEAYQCTQRPPSSPRLKHLQSSNGVRLNLQHHSPILLRSKFPQPWHPRLPTPVTSRTQPSVVSCSVLAVQCRSTPDLRSHWGEVSASKLVWPSLRSEVRWWLVAGGTEGGG
jgi:hypothetical protein